MYIDTGSDRRSKNNILLGISGKPSLEWIKVLELLIRDWLCLFWRAPFPDALDGRGKLEARSTRDLAANICKRGRIGWMNRHSLCPANEYIPIVHTTVLSIVLKAVPCNDFEMSVDQIPCIVNGSAVVQRIGTA